jgi:hypothetical protein
LRKNSEIFAEYYCRLRRTSRRGKTRKRSTVTKHAVWLTQSEIPES